MLDRKLKLSWILLGLFCTGSMTPLIASDDPIQLPSESNYTPWLMGPLIAPTGEVVTKGHFTFQPYLYFNVNTGIYNSHWKRVSTPNFYNVTLQLETQVGLTEFMDFQIVPAVLYNHTEGESATRFGDFPLIFDFQLLSVDKYKWFPGIKLGITETFPTGKYQKLNPKKLDTDASGLGSFSTGVDLVFYKVYHIHKHHFLSMTASVQYTYFAPVHVKGLSVYEGTPDTHGKVYPGNTTTAIVSFEYTLTQNWVLSLDNIYTHENKDRFKGSPGFIAPFIPGVVGRPSSEQLSFAPAIEYNFSEHYGFMAGSLFSAAGRNALDFYSAILSFMVAY